MSPQSPTFELHVFDDATEVKGMLQDVPSIQRALFVDGVPKGFIGRRYMVDYSLTFSLSHENEPLVRFGSTGLADSVCVSLATGRVVEVINAPRAPLLFVNRSLEQFTQTVKMVIGRFPYYAEGATEDEICEVAEELRTMIRSIDPEAVMPDRYWSTLIDDVEIGNLSTEAILAIGYPHSGQS